MTTNLVYATVYTIYFAVYVALLFRAARLLHGERLSVNQCAGLLAFVGLWPLWILFVVALVVIGKDAKAE